MRPQSQRAQDDTLIQSRGKKNPLIFHNSVLYEILPLKHKSIAIVRFMKDHMGRWMGLVGSNFPNWFSRTSDTL